ncbi:unnamed protein product [Pleuronectes platessa]|uniref:Uncharacterized protein n=1 Tax=Pleuronectes platessa TaxID=8262 RepID=A0A9N7Z7U4_PLEPL|nr:unnamed protein product [Pleuronectes platessa]
MGPGGKGDKNSTEPDTLGTPPLPPPTATAAATAALLYYSFQSQSTAGCELSHPLVHQPAIWFRLLLHVVKPWATIASKKPRTGSLGYTGAKTRSLRFAPTFSLSPAPWTLASHAGDSQPKSRWAQGERSACPLGLTPSLGSQNPPVTLRRDRTTRPRGQALTFNRGFALPPPHSTVGERLFPGSRTVTVAYGSVTFVSGFENIAAARSVLSARSLAKHRSAPLIGRGRVT